MTCRTLLTSAAVFGLLTAASLGSAHADPKVLDQSISKDALKQQCSASGGESTEGKNGNYGCMGESGYVTCNKGGTCVGDSWGLVVGDKPVNRFPEAGTSVQTQQYTPEMFIAPRDRGAAVQPQTLDAQGGGDGHPGVGSINGTPPEAHPVSGETRLPASAIQSQIPPRACVGACALAPVPHHGGHTSGHPGY